MKVIQTNTFSKIVKKLHASQKKELDIAVREIMVNPHIGTKKAGDLDDVYVYKFKLSKQTTLLAYSYAEQIITLTLLALGTHENLYRDLKKKSH